MGFRAETYRKQNAAFADWAAGYGVIEHSDLTQCRIFQIAEELELTGRVKSKDEVFRACSAADLVTNAGMWLVVHMTYAQNVYLDGRDLKAEDFKKNPEGHTGGALNMVPAYAGYLLANALSGKTRPWLMGQGHCVAAIDALNIIVDNMTTEHAARYGLSDEGLTRFVRDFYSYAVLPNGKPESPLGSHVNPHTAGGIQEGGYLGFAELYYAHMPLPGEELVVFLSDGAFEEQRGSDWAPRWWRPKDSGSVIPIMIANGRRIDQRTTMSQQGGVDWFREHLQLNNFSPYDIDGRDPAAFAWAILSFSEQLDACRNAELKGESEYPIRLPYAIAETVKGFGFPGAGHNAAHNLPLGGSPASVAEARSDFHSGARRLWVPPTELASAVKCLSTHDQQKRVRERDHVLARIEVRDVEYPEPHWKQPGEVEVVMAGIDTYFSQIVRENPELRPRVGNPDELRSNRMGSTLDYLKHRVTAPEQGVAEDLHGAVITALNEEAIVCAALANKRGLNIAVSYEAFAVKMLGALRQEIIFSRHQKETGSPAGWLSVPIVLTSHTWENGKNEQSHQDPSLCEVLMNEMSDISRVVFPADCNTAAAALRACYQSRGEIWTLVVAKRELPVFFSREESEQLIRDGAIRVSGDSDAEIHFIATGSYQLVEAIRAAERLTERGISTAVTYLSEPGRFRSARDYEERQHVISSQIRDELFFSSKAQVYLCHCRPETLLGVVRPLDRGAESTRALGYINRGGTLDVAGMLFANRTTWAHAVAEAIDAAGRKLSDALDESEIAAIQGEGDPRILR